MNTYGDLLTSNWLQNATLPELRQAGVVLGILNFSTNQNTNQTRNRITSFLQASPQTLLPIGINAPWTLQQPLPQPRRRNNSRTRTTNSSTQQSSQPGVFVPISIAPLSLALTPNTALSQPQSQNTNNNQPPTQPQPQHQNSSLPWILGLIAAGFLIYGIIRTLGWI